MTPVERWKVITDSATRSFRTRDAAEDWVRLLDERNVTHTDIERVVLADDPDEVKGIGGN